MLEFVSSHCEALTSMPSALVSVSLSAASRDRSDLEGLAKCLAQLERATGWHPNLIHHAAGAFRFNRYGLLRRWAMKYIAWRKGQPTGAHEDYELTDWARLAAFIDDFVGGSLDQRRGARL
jgi:menaquinone-dependent protoporphyrinogen oxidase